MTRPLYLYGVAPATLPAAALAALDRDAGLFAVGGEALTAVVGPFALGDLPTEVLEERLRSLEAVAPLAQRHQEVVAALARLGPVVPARLCSLFSSTDRVQDFLREQGGLLLRLLEVVGGRSEWGLKVLSDQGRLAETLAAADPAAQLLLAAAAAAGPGQAYVLRRQHAARADALGAARTDEVLDEVLAALWPLMHRHRDRDLPPAGAAAGPVVVMHLAALVDDDAVAGWGAAVDGLAAALAAEGFLFERSGPWPPYSFCGLVEAAEDAP